AVSAAMLEIVAVQKFAIGEHGSVFIDAKLVRQNLWRGATERAYATCLVIHRYGMNYGSLAGERVELNDITLVGTRVCLKNRSLLPSLVCRVPAVIYINVSSINFDAVAIFIFLRLRVAR